MAQKTEEPLFEMKKDQSGHSPKQQNRIENNSTGTKTISLLHWHAFIFSN
jgi:hypothetical protein